jgi:transposase
VVMKHCPPEFKADAIALYQSRPGATIRWVAADLGVNPETLRNWARAAGANRLRCPPTPLEVEHAGRAHGLWPRSGGACGRHRPVSA